MARPIKKGLNYFPFETGFFQTERAQMLRARYGSDGITLYIGLLCKVYGAGYYLEIENEEDFYFVLASEFGINQNKVRQIFTYLLKRSMFDAHLFKTVNVLTAAEIQFEYVCAMRRRKRTLAEIRGKHWLLTDEQERELETFYKSTLLQKYPDNSEKNPDYSQKNPCYSAKNAPNKIKGNERKGEETEKEESKKEERAERESYAEIMENFGVAPQVKGSLWEFVRHCQLNGRTITNDKLEKLIVRLDMQYGKDEPGKAAALNKAVAKGYFDIK